MRQEIPIVMAANDKYVPYMGIAIQSLIEHSSDIYFYHIHILTEGFNESHIYKLKSLESANIRIEIVNVKEIMKRWAIATVKHLSKETTYRLLVDKLFANYNKILYLDSDIVINKDVAELYNVDIGDNILGVSIAAIFEGTVDYLREELKVNMGHYFNAGVLLINIKEFAKDDIGNKGLEMLSNKKYMCQDQDVLNILCEGKVKIFDGRWNVEWQYYTKTAGELVIDENRKCMLSYIDKPYIVHYTSHIKPWKHPEIMLAEYFWEYARKSIFYEEILKQSILEQRNDSIWENFIFPWDKIPAKSNVILYAYGNVGKTFLKQLIKTNYCNIVAVCDQNVMEIESEYDSIPMIKINAINSFDYDYILVAIEKENIAMEVILNLKENNIDNKKIVWKNPNREDKR